MAYYGDYDALQQPDIQAKVEQWVSQTGRPAEELLEDTMAGYFDELAKVRQTLDSRYDDIKSGKVKSIPGDSAQAELLLTAARDFHPEAGKGRPGLVS